MECNFRIRVVENIGELSEAAFGTPETIHEIISGTLTDSEGYSWIEDFRSLEEIHKFFNEKAIDDCFSTKFELVEEE